MNSTNAFIFFYLKLFFDISHDTGFIVDSKKKNWNSVYFLPWGFNSNFKKYLNGKLNWKKMWKTSFISFVDVEPGCGELIA